MRHGHQQTTGPSDALLWKAEIRRRSRWRNDALRPAPVPAQTRRRLCLESVSKSGRKIATFPAKGSAQRRRDVAAVDGGHVGGGLERERLRHEGLRDVLGRDLAPEQVAA